MLELPLNFSGDGCMGKRILVVDDKELNRDLMKALLNVIDHECVAAASAEEALDIIAADSDFDIVMTDITMPGGMNGEELALELKEKMPELPIICMSGDSLYVHKVFFGFIYKPFNLNDIRDALNSL